MKNQPDFLKENSSLPVLKFSVSFLIFLLWLSPTKADNVITNGATIRINSGTFVTSAQNLVVENGGGLVIDGSLILKNNLTNQNTVGELGTGSIEFSGTTPQSLSGQNTVGSLVLNNPAGLDISGSTILNTGLGLQTGHVRLGTNNLTLGSMATIIGTPSASAMVVDTGIGELRKSFSGTGVFTFPVGDNSGIAEYSPVTLNFTSGTFAPGNYAAVKLINSAYPGYSSNGLNRYWSIAQSGITNSQYDAVFQYVPGDINGNENNIQCIQVEPTPIVSYNPANTNLHQLTANGLASFGVFTGIATTINQDIALNIGWNIISSYVTPVNLNLKDLFQTLIDAGKLKKVMDEAGKTIENFGAFGGWKNNIGNLNSTEGYKVNMLSNSTLSLEGTPVPLPLDITLATGWNIISYPSATAQDAKALVQSLIDAGKLKKVMDEAGKTIENFGAFGGWKNNIGNFMPGKGYKVNVTEDCILTIPADGTKSVIVVPEVLASTHFTKAFIGNGTDHMNIHLVNLQASGLKAGDEIGVFDGKRCVGSAQIGPDQMLFDFISIPASCNDESGEPNGFTPGNAITISLFRNNQEYLLNTELLYNSKSMFVKGESLFARVNTEIATGLIELPESVSVKCYPNPFNDQITIKIDVLTIQNLDVKIYDVSGRLIRYLYQGKTIKGITLIWDGKNDQGIKMVSGSYYLKANDNVEKIMLKH